MKRFRFIQLLWILIILFLFTGCSAVKEATTELDSSAKQLTPPTGKSLIYIVRPAGLGTAVSFDVSIDNKYIGTTGGSRFIYTLTSPGKHTLKSEAENDSFLEITVSSDSTYYVRQNVSMGFLKARNELELLSPAEGRKDLQECKLSSECVEIRTPK